MSTLSHNELVILFFSLGLLLLVARFLGEVARRYNQPSVLGEMLAGILLGPTVMGTIAPDVQFTLFPQTGDLAVVLSAITTLAITLFLFIAGMELDLSAVWRQGRAALGVSFGGMVIPFAAGFSASWFFPTLMGVEPGEHHLIFSLFMGTALSISALPIIAKTMMDLNIYRSDIGMVIISAAIINDIVGWMIFAVILGMIGGPGHPGMTVGHTALLTVSFVAFTLTIGRWLLDKILPWLQAHTSWPAGILGFGMVSTLFAAAFTEWIGLHGIFGAFIFGVAFGDSPHLREKTRTTIDQFVSSFFAPLFFASIGLKVNFAANFDFMLVVTILVIATFGKVIGSGLGARFNGFAWRESAAIGFGMNSLGTIGIILGLLALEAGVIGERVFVAMVVMALITSFSSGPIMERLLKRRKVKKVHDFLSSKGFILEMQAETRYDAIAELVRVACEGTKLSISEMTDLVWDREQIIPTTLEKGIAVPHAKIYQLEQPLVAIGISRRGIDFEASDGELSRVIFLILAPASDHGVLQLELLSDITETFQKPQMVEKTLAVKNYTEFLALLKSGE